MRTRFCVIASAWLVVILASCTGGKQEIALSEGHAYKLQPSGKMTVYASDRAEGAAGALPLHKLKVKVKNEGAAAKTADCWACTDCICNTDDCSCTECTSC